MLTLDTKLICVGNADSLKDKPDGRLQNLSGILKDSLRVSPAGKPRAPKEAKPSKLFIYLIEDDPHFRETFLDVMSLRGVEAKSASCGAQALRDLEILRPSIIIIDVRLPDLHGFDLCRLIRRIKDFKKTPIILISASFRYNDPRDQVEGLLAGASLFLSKPMTMENLWAEIDSLLNRNGR
jgi:CheY-like chemotaxis protein